MLNLLLIAYSMIEFETVMTIPCFFIIVLVCLGLKETAVALADPFGGDDVDFETEVYMAQMLSNAKSMISEESMVSAWLLPVRVSSATAIELVPGTLHT